MTSHGISNEHAESLLEAARKAAIQAYVPYSGFPVGAALELEDGSIVTGCNVEMRAIHSPSAPSGWPWEQLSPRTGTSGPSP